jgi:23S rRNA pseudouridine1911/1915/1917 synthase
MTNMQLVVGEDALLDNSSEPGADRLDRWLTAHVPDQSRSVIQRWIKEGSVLVNNAPVRASYRVIPGDAISITVSAAPRPATVDAEPIPLAILYEDGDVVVINKAAGVVVHPAPGHQVGTLVNAILYHVPDLAGIGGEMRPGIVHRLDKDTSGVLVVAKHEAALRDLQSQFKSRKVDKEYIALVEGKISVDQGRIVALIGRDLRDRKRMAVIAPENLSTAKARPATTEYQVLARYVAPLHNDLGRGAFTLVQAHPITGRTHQIRVHFASIGHPLVGDPIYGLKRQRLAAPRLFLHAARLAFRLPSSGLWREFQAPLPAELQSLLDHLEHMAL